MQTRSCAICLDEAHKFRAYANASRPALETETENDLTECRDETYGTQLVQLTRADPASKFEAHFPPEIHRNHEVM